MIPKYFDELEAKVRCAALARHYDDVVASSNHFANSIQAYVRSLPVGDPLRADAVARLMELLDWTLIILRGARTACARELRQATAANLYAQKSASRPKSSGIQVHA